MTLRRARRNPMAEFESRTPGMAPEHEVRDLPLSLIDHNPAQFRQSFDENTLRELADSIAEQGLIEPIVVRRKDGRFEIVAGERRYRALLLLTQEGRGPDGVPAVIRDLTDTEALLIIAAENLQREDLDIEDEGRMFQSLIDHTGLTQRSLAEKLGLNRKYIDRRLALLKKPDLLAAYRRGEITLHQAVAGVELQDESGSAGPTELSTVVERSDLEQQTAPRETQVSGYTRRTSPTFVWRPWTSFTTLLDKTTLDIIPADERETFKAQLDTVIEKAQALRAQLETEQD